MNKTPKIFISYSWTTPEHESWIINIAERLVSDGVNVIFDKWDLKEGQDKYNFMESMVKSSDIQKVLIILDKEYSQKAEKRIGGVGTETQIISSEIYEDVSQEKFIPIISEKDDEGRPYMPSFLRNRIYIDFSEENNFEENYEKLLRNIFQRPAFSKPKLGKAPSYLFDETLMKHKTSSIVRSFENQVVKFPERINSIIKDFLEEFFDDLKNYTVNIKNVKDIYTFGKTIYDNIISYTVLRNDYINFINKLLKSKLEFDIDILIKFFEKLPLLKDPLNPDETSWNKHEFDNFKFIIHELFLYTIAIGLKNENYSFLEELYYSGYFFQRRSSISNTPKRFDQELYNEIKIFDEYYKQTYSTNFISPMADIIIKRIPDSLSLDNLTDADLLSYYIGSLDNLYWFPLTYIYRRKDEYEFELFIRMQSQRHFEKIKILESVI